MKFKLTKIKTINIKHYRGKVYDLTVQNNHSYNINKMIVHNSLCETRIRTGVGTPQITAIMNCSEAADQYDVPIIADGGIRYIADVAKALAAGASSVMLGSLLAGTDESPGEIQKVGKWPNENLFKNYRGSASLKTKIANGIPTNHIEGNSKDIPYKGSVREILSSIKDGLQSSMSYVNSENLDEFHLKAKFEKVTLSGHLEGKPHLIRD
jgi:IMP dehydrogenase